MSSSSVAIAQQSFIHSSSLSPTVHRVKLRVPITRPVSCCKISSEQDRNDPESPRGTDSHLAKLAMVALAAGVLTLGPAQKASAAKSNGRVDIEKFRSSVRRSSTPGIMAVRSDLHDTPVPTSPFGGGGRLSFGVPLCGTWGWAPMCFSTMGPRVSGTGAGFGFIGAFQLLMFLLVFASVGGAIVSFFRTDDDDAANNLK